MAATPRRSGEATISVARERGQIFDVALGFEAVPADGLQQRARHREHVEPEIADWVRIVSRPLPDHVAPRPDRNRAGLREVVAETGEQMLERLLPAGEQRVRMARLRRPCARRGGVGSVSRSRTTTRSTKGATAFAAASPPIPAPMTTACVPIVLVINIPE